MVRILIIEDEALAAGRLVSLLKSIDFRFEVLDVIDTVKEAITWLLSNPSPDLIFMDVNLADGNSFGIIDQVEISSPIIFITAYDEYALKAFSLNSIDYLLKPLKKVDLERAVRKFEMQSANRSRAALKELINSFKTSDKAYQKRMVLRIGQAIKVVEISDIAYFFTEEKAGFLCTFDGLRYILDQNLDEIMNMVNPADFFRINRQVIVNYRSIAQMTAFSKARVKLQLNPPVQFDTIVSAERSPEFKIWLTGK